MGFPIVFEHMDACGIARGKKIKVPAIAATAAILVSHGADEILMPAPSSYEADRAAEGISLLPKERQHLVKLVDTKGHVLNRVRSYLEPLVSQAKKWPEDAFVGFTENFLYQMAMASDFKAGVADDTVQIVREFIPILDSRSFRGEAKFRLAEIVHLICEYEPNVADQGAFRFDSVTQSDAAPQVWDLIEGAEFGALVRAAGRIGYLKHPVVAFRRLQKLTRAFFRKRQTSELFTLATSVAELAGAQTAAQKAKSIAALICGSPSETAFSPSFVDLGPSQLGIYRFALASVYPTADPPDGTILMFERSRAGRISTSWLSEGEEQKLQREAEESITRSTAKLREARLASKRLL